MSPFLGFRALRTSGPWNWRCYVPYTNSRSLCFCTWTIAHHVLNGSPSLTELRKASGLWRSSSFQAASWSITVADNNPSGYYDWKSQQQLCWRSIAKEVLLLSVPTTWSSTLRAADRMNEQSLTSINPYNPSILRLINNVIKAAHAEARGQVCVENAGD